MIDQAKPCALPGCPLPVDPVGQRRRFCSTAHRTAARRQRLATRLEALAATPGPTLTAPTAGGWAPTSAPPHGSTDRVRAGPVHHAPAAAPPVPAPGVPDEVGRVSAGPGSTTSRSAPAQPAAGPWDPTAAWVIDPTSSLLPPACTRPRPTPTGPPGARDTEARVGSRTVAGVAIAGLLAAVGGYLWSTDGMPPVEQAAPNPGAGTATPDPHRSATRAAVTLASNGQRIEPDTGGSATSPVVPAATRAQPTPLPLVVDRTAPVVAAPVVAAPVVAAPSVAAGPRQAPAVTGVDRPAAAPLRRLPLDRTPATAGPTAAAPVAAGLPIAPVVAVPPPPPPPLAPTASPAGTEAGRPVVARPPLDRAPAPTGQPSGSPVAAPTLDGSIAQAPAGPATTQPAPTSATARTRPAGKAERIRGRAATPRPSAASWPAPAAALPVDDPSDRTRPAGKTERARARAAVQTDDRQATTEPTPADHDDAQRHSTDRDKGRAVSTRDSSDNKNAKRDNAKRDNDKRDNDKRDNDKRGSTKQDKSKQGNSKQGNSKQGNSKQGNSKQGKAKRDNADAGTIDRHQVRSTPERRTGKKITGAGSDHNRDPRREGPPNGRGPADG